MDWFERRKLWGLLFSRNDGDFYVFVKRLSQVKSGRRSARDFAEFVIKHRADIDDSYTQEGQAAFSELLLACEDWDASSGAESLTLACEPALAQLQEVLNEYGRSLR